MLKKLSREFYFFILAAASSAISDIVIFTLLVHLGLYFVYCQGISRIIGGVVSFLINKNLSFNRHRRRALIEIRRFLLLYAASYLLSFFILWFLHQQMGLTLLYAKPIADGSCFVVNFIMMKFYVYNPVRGLLFRLRAINWFRKGGVDDPLRG